jgi:hypothetical protein
MFLIPDHKIVTRLGKETIKNSGKCRFDFKNKIRKIRLRARFQGCRMN